LNTHPLFINALNGLVRRHTGSVAIEEAPLALGVGA
jgi:hypothetical protein